MFVVEWIQQALDDLMVLWMQAGSNQRQAITEASKALEQKLGTDPTGAGESRGNDERIVFVPPLGVVVEVDQVRRVVWVIHVWGLRRRDKP